VEDGKLVRLRIFNYAEVIPLARPMVVRHRQPSMTEIACGTWKLDTFVRLNGGIDVLERGFMIAPAEKLEPAHHDLHVLLRHRLLPQSHGFEGVLSPEIAAVRDDHPVTQLNHHGARLRARRAALRPAYANPHEREYRIAKVDQLIDLVQKLVEDFRRQTEEGPYLVVSSVGPSHKRRRVDHIHRIGVELVPGRLTGLVPVLHEPLDDLDVLLRHRPPSIPRLTPGA
jgi:hypothetical protein